MKREQRLLRLMVPVQLLDSEARSQCHQALIPQSHEGVARLGATSGVPEYW